MWYSCDPKSFKYIYMIRLLQKEVYRSVGVTIVQGLKVLNSSLKKINEFETQLRYYVYFSTNTLKT